MKIIKNHFLLVFTLVFFLNCPGQIYAQNNVFSLDDRIIGVIVDDRIQFYRYSAWYNTWAAAPEIDYFSLPNEHMELPR